MRIRTAQELRDAILARTRNVEVEKGAHIDLFARPTHQMKITLEEGARLTGAVANECEKGTAHIYFGGRRPDGIPEGDVADGS